MKNSPIKRHQNKKSLKQNPIRWGATLLTAVCSMIPQFIQAADDIWNQTTAGTYSWNAATNWFSGTQFPNGIGDVASVTNIGGTQTINLNQAITVGKLYLGDNVTPFFATTVAPGGGSLVFDVPSGHAGLVQSTPVNTGVANLISANVALNVPLDISYTWGTSRNQYQISGVVSGIGGINVIAPSQPAGGGAAQGTLDLQNTNNSFTGDMGVANGVVFYRGSVLSGQNSALGNSTNAITIGNSASLVGSGTPNFTSQPTMQLLQIVSDDTSDYAFTRDLDFSQTSGSPAAMGGRGNFTFNGNGAGGVNLNTLTIGGVVKLASAGRGTEFVAQRQGMTILFTNDIIQGAAPLLSSSVLYLGPISPSATSSDGPVGGNYHFTDMSRSFVSQVWLDNGTLIIDGNVPASGLNSPIGQGTPFLSDGNGGNIAMINGQDSKRAIFLTTPGASFARNLTIGGGQSGAYNGSSTFNVFNGYKFGGQNTNGIVTFSGQITANDPIAGVAQTNVITVGQNVALIAATGGTVEFTGNFLAPGSLTTRVTINQFRNHPNVDANPINGIPDPGVADAAVGTPTAGTVTLSGLLYAYTGSTEILGGTLKLNNGSALSSQKIVVSAGTLLLPNGGSDRINDITPVVLGAGSAAASIALSGDVTETVGILSVGGSAVDSIDFGSGTNAATVNSSLTFDNSSAAVWTNNLQILNWAGSTNGAGLNQLFFGVDATGLTAGQKASITFVNPNGISGNFAATQLPTGEVVPVIPASPSAPPNFPPGGITVSGAGIVSLTATGAVGAPYHLWASTNVAATPVTNTWTLLTNGTISVSPFTVTDPAATNYSSRFYLFSTP
jgi:autotransporter-associated beta strand protein